MIETAQKEIQRLRWAMTLQKCGYNTFCVLNSHVFSGGNRKLIQDVNWQRKNEQLTGGAKLRELESKYVCLYGVLMSPSLRKMFLFCCDLNICPSTAGCLWSVRTMRSSGPLSSWRTKSLSSGSSRATRTRRTSGKTFKAAESILGKRILSLHLVVARE